MYCLRYEGSYLESIGSPNIEADEFYANISASSTAHIRLGVPPALHVAVTQVDFCKE
jgi:hypothetical protein